jgi:hypothetical protein
MVSGARTITPPLAALAAAERLPQGLLHWMIGTHGLYIYGGLLKRIIDPVSTVPLGDVDVIALDAKVMEVMTERFGLVFRRVNTTITRTPYFIGKAGHGDAKIVHLALLRSHEQTMRYVMNNQLDIDRLALSNHHIFYDPNFDLGALCNAIRAKRATRVQGMRDMTLFAKNRPQIEHHYEVRLQRKGYTVID